MTKQDENPGMDRRSFLQRMMAGGTVFGIDFDWDSFWGEEDTTVTEDSCFLSFETASGDSISPVTSVMLGDGLSAVKSGDSGVKLTGDTGTPTVSSRYGIADQHKASRYTETDRAGVLTTSTASLKHLDVTGVHAVALGQGLSVIDISDPTNMVEMGTLPDTDVWGYGVTVWGDVAYVTEMPDSQLTAVDISDPFAPVVGGSASIGGPRKVAIRGNYAYCSSKETTGEFHVVDISDPLNPTTVTSLADPNFERSFEIAIRGDTAFVVGRRYDAVTAVDISNPSTPSIVGSYSGSPLVEPYGISIQDEYAYVTLSDNGHGIAVLDISDPTVISSVGSVTDSTNLNSPYGLDVEGYYAYAACKDNDTFTTFDLSDPAAPVIHSTVSPSSYDRPYDVVVKDGFAFSVSRGSNTISAFGTRDRKWG